MSSAATHLRAFDLALIALYLLAITLFGLRFRKSGTAAERSLKSYFLASNTIPWWAIALSIVSAETSTLTIISVPGVAFAGDFGFLQIVLGYMLGRVVVALLFLPRYFAGEMLTAYQLIDQRFGRVLHKVTAGLFLLTRAAAEGVRVFAVSIVVGIAIGTGDTLSIGIICLLTLLYTFEGGMAAVVWTDVVQMAIYVAGTLVAVWSLGHHIPGGWVTIHTVAGAAGKFHLFNFALDLTTTYTFWAGVLGGTFLTMASHGTDQLMVQRMLAARSLRESRLALLSSGVVIFIQFTLFLLIGAGLYVFYAGRLSHGLTPDRLFPTFIVHEMPVGIAGLLIAAVLAAAMSNLSAALNSLSSTTVVDFYLHLRPQADARERNLVSKSSTVLWAIVLFVIAVYSLSVGGKGHVVEIGLSIASVAYGCLLGVFLLGTLTKFATEIGATIGMVCGFALNVWLWQGAFPKVIYQAAVINNCPNGADICTHTLIVPHIAFTWYVLIGAVVTFAIGALASLLFRKQARRTTITAAVSLLLLFLLSSTKGICLPPAAVQQSTTAPDFSQVTQLINDAIAAHKLPGAVVLIGHGNKIVFEQAYGNRKLAGEPGLDGQPSAAEPMSEDTIFDMASLTKCLATATAVMQLYEQGRIASFDDPVEKYLPAFNEAHDPQRSKVTLRMLLTHTSGEAPDISLKDPWGLAEPDRAEGLRRALTTPLKTAPGATFTYSDINFILLGDLVETLSSQREDDYTQQNIFKPLNMTRTRYLPLDRVSCYDKSEITGAAIGYELSGNVTDACLHEPGAFTKMWMLDRWLPNIAPTTHDDESKSNPAANPHFDMLTRGTVHDPTARRMGGVAGHAGVFSTAHDVSLYAQALLDKLLHNTGPFPLKQSTLRLMVVPEQPGANQGQVLAANDAARKLGASLTDPLLAAAYPAIPGQNLRGFGWDIDTAFSKPRGMVFPVGSFGHTGFTGTSLWIDPASDTYVILLANAIHPRGGAPISGLRGEVATAAARALGLANIAYQPKDCDGRPDGPPVTVEQAAATELYCRTSGATDCPGVLVCASDSQLEAHGVPQSSLIADTEHTFTGIDVLEATHFAAFAGLHRLGLLTNQAGLDARGRRTIDVLLDGHQPLTTLFSPEHGISGTLDQSKVASGMDAATHLPVVSLYGTHDADRRPTHEQLAGLDAVIIDLQDAGVPFWTYEAAAAYFLEAAATEQAQYHHDLQIIVLDRPNPVGGLAVQGPVSEPGLESYVNYMPLPVRHGLTLGELLRYANGEKHLAHTEPAAPAGPGGVHATHTSPRVVDESGVERYADGTRAKGIGAHLTVVPMQHWVRSMFYSDTGLPWVNPSPNLRSPEAALRYPALGLIETTNISVGRGTEHPFSFFGAPYIDARAVAAALNARRIPGVTFTAAKEPIAEDANHYLFHGQSIPAVELTLTDPALADTPEIGVEILSVLHKLYPTEFHLDRVKTLLRSQATIDALQRGDDPHAIAATWQPALDAFRAGTAPYLLYP